jgi:hypothetical protein
MGVHLERVIFGLSKDIDFGKFNIGALTKAVAYDLKEFDKQGVQGVKILEGDITRLITYEKSAKRAAQPYIQAGTVAKDLVIVVRDKKNDKFEALAYVVKDYKGLREKLEKSTAAVTNLDKGDEVIDPASERQGERFKATVDEGDYGKITGNIILCAHGRPAKVPSGRVIGDEFGQKTPEEIVKLITGDKDPNKRIGKDYNGIVTLSGCFTASGGPEASKQDDPFAAKVLQLLRGKGYSKVSVVGMPGPSITAKSGDTDSHGTPLRSGDKKVLAKLPGSKEYQEYHRLDDLAKKALEPYKTAIAEFNKLVDPYNNAQKAMNEATQDKKVAATKTFNEAKTKLENARNTVNSTKTNYEQAVKNLEDSGLTETIGHLKGTFGLRTVEW